MEREAKRYWVWQVRSAHDELFFFFALNRPPLFLNKKINVDDASIIPDSKQLRVARKSG